MVYDPTQERQGSESLINSAFLDARRRSGLQTAIATCLITPLSFSVEDNSYHYALAFNSLVQLFCEISPKLTQLEIDTIVELQNSIQDMVDENNIFKNQYNDGMLIGKIVNQEKWKELRNKLYLFNLAIKRLVDTRGFGSPDKRNPRKAIMDM